MLRCKISSVYRLQGELGKMIYSFYFIFLPISPMVVARYNRKGTLSGIPKTGSFLVQGPKIPRQFR